jgi:C-terminal processing protease CtpA/Prc
MKIYLITGALVLMTGFGIGYYATQDTATENAVDSATAELTQEVVSDVAPPADSSPALLAQEITHLKQRLAAEIRSREMLEQKVAVLAKALAKNDTLNDDEALTSSSDDNSTNNSTPPERDDLATRQQQALIALGMDPSAMERIKQRTERQEMEELYLRDRANREGWFGTERYFQEARKLEQNSNVYRQELGDVRYDTFLFDSGQNNRVGVQSVLNGSPAAAAGIQADDIIVSYDNERVFTWNDLTSATTKGTPGQTVRIDVKRDQQSLTFYVPRGPLGIRLTPARADPNGG